MKMPVLAALCCASLAACASNSSHVARMEQGYAPGALGVGAIARADWEKAETLLTARNSSASRDPARLINLGKVYMETGRADLAVATWERALASKHHHEVETADGRVVSTQDLAREALNRYSPTVASR
jgi:hypothetical protein